VDTEVVGQPRGPVCYPVCAGIASGSDAERNYPQAKRFVGGGPRPRESPPHRTSNGMLAVAPAPLPSRSSTKIR